MIVLERFRSWVVWIGTVSTFLLGWFSVKNDNDLPDFVFRHKKTILFVLGLLSVFATLNNPTNPNGF